MAGPMRRTDARRRAEARPGRRDIAADVPGWPGLSFELPSRAPYKPVVPALIDAIRIVVGKPEPGV